MSELSVSLCVNQVLVFGVCVTQIPSESCVVLTTYVSYVELVKVCRIDRKNSNNMMTDNSI